MDQKDVSLKTVERAVVDFVVYLKERHRLPVSAVYLFGSYARGYPREGSDVDVCVVSPRFSREDSLSYLWTRRRPRDVENLIAPVGFSPEEFDAPTPSPLVHEIQTSGKKITL